MPLNLGDAHVAEGMTTSTLCNSLSNAEHKGRWGERGANVAWSSQVRSLGKEGSAVHYPQPFY